jgi:hypothetical protein
MFQPTWPSLGNTKHIPTRINGLSEDVRKFQSALKGFLLEGSF